ncbi:hypothetical protein [Gordonia sp. KTR9]|uniref:hypothetical protein n=1 Tax=Gordonia sp. KTR9 TaxID=337191 RepID=UPI000677FE11|nr:hypothetical protein [Gordonia sp. KTR9]
MTDTTTTSTTGGAAWAGDAGEPTPPADSDAGQNARQAPDPTDDPATDGTDDPAGDELEARKYRRRAQAAEGELATVTARLEAAQRSQVAAFAADLAQPADVLDPALGGVDLAALLDDDGQVSAELVAAAVAEQLAVRPGLGKVQPTVRGTYQQSGQFANPPRLTPAKSPGWSKMLKR